MTFTLQALWQAHERQDKAVTDLRQKVRQLRQDVEAKDKQLSLAYRTVERLAIDKNALEVGTWVFIPRITQELNVYIH